MRPRRATLAIAALGLAGIAIAGYLTWVHSAELAPYCVGGGGACERVQSSPYAELAGVPVAVIGLGGYVAILASLRVGASVTVFLAFVGAGFSAYLTYIELAVIDAICQWCVASAIVMAAIAAVSAVRYLRIRLPPAQEAAEREAVTGNATRTTVRPAADSISS